MFFTGHKDTDRLIIESIDNEKDFLSVSLVNSYFNELYNENLFHRRILKKYPDVLQYKGDLSYKNLFLFIVHYINKIKTKYNFVFSNGNPVDYYNLLNARMLQFHRIKEAIRKGYTDLAIFLSNNETVNNRLFTGLLSLSVKFGNKILVDYYINRYGFESIYSYEKLARIADISGHFKLSDYFRCK